MKLIKVKCKDADVPSLADVKKDYEAALRKYVPGVFGHGQGGVPASVKKRQRSYEFWIGDNGRALKDVEKFMQAKYPGFTRTESSSMSTTWVLEW